MRFIINNLQRGAAQPHVYAKDVNHLKLLIPNEELIKAANERLKIIHSEIATLQTQSANLTRQRDLLLPRLMSGQLPTQ
jgi:type I restriction enzyme S subunit